MATLRQNRAAEKQAEKLADQKLFVDLYSSALIAGSNVINGGGKLTFGDAEYPLQSWAHMVTTRAMLDMIRTLKA